MRLFTLVSICVILVKIAVASEGNAAVKQPHLVFILADDQGWNNIGLHNPDLIGENTKNVAAVSMNPTMTDRTTSDCTCMLASYFSSIELHECVL